MDAPVSYGSRAAAVEAGRVLKASGGALIAFQVNSGGTAGWVMLLDSATVPADGAVLPVKWWQVAINQTLGMTFQPPLALFSGITLVFSTTGPFTKTGSATAVFSGETQ